MWARDKDPDARKDYLHDWSTWLGEGDTITASEWITPDGLTASGADHDDTTAWVWLSGGTLGRAYFVVNRVTTALGRVEDETLTLRIVGR